MYISNPASAIFRGGSGSAVSQYISTQGDLIAGNGSESYVHDPAENPFAGGNLALYTYMVADGGAMSSTALSGFSVRSINTVLFNTSITLRERLVAGSFGGTLSTNAGAPTTITVPSAGTTNTGAFGIFIFSNINAFVTRSEGPVLNSTDSNISSTIPSLPTNRLELVIVYYRGWSPTDTPLSTTANGFTFLRPLTIGGSNINADTGVDLRGYSLGYRHVRGGSSSTTIDVEFANAEFKWVNYLFYSILA